MDQATTAPDSAHDYIINKLLQESNNVKCVYANVSAGECVKKTTLDSCEKVDNFLRNSGGIGDCTSVTQALLFRTYIEDNEEAWEFIREKCKLDPVPDPSFHICFNKNFEHEQQDDKGVLCYLRHEPFYELMDTEAYKFIATNAAGWWCVGLGKSNFNETHPNLWYGDFDENKESYLTFWGKRDGTDCTMVITHMDIILNKLVETAKKDFKRSKESLKNENLKMCVEGIMDIKLRKNNLTMDSVKKINFAAIFENEGDPILNACIMLENKANVLVHGDNCKVLDV